MDGTVPLENWESAEVLLVRKWAENTKRKKNGNQYMKLCKVTLKKSWVGRFLNKRNGRCPRTCL